MYHLRNSRTRTAPRRRGSPSRRHIHSGQAVAGSKASASTRPSSCSPPRSASGPLPGELLPREHIDDATVGEVDDGIRTLAPVGPQEDDCVPVRPTSRGKVAACQGAHGPAAQESLHSLVGGREGGSL